MREDCREYKLELQMPVCQVNEHCPYQEDPGFQFEGERFLLCGKYFNKVSDLPIVYAVVPEIPNGLEGKIVFKEDKSVH